MSKRTKIAKERTTLREIVLYLGAITMLGTFGGFLAWAVETSHCFDALCKLSSRQFVEWLTLAPTSLVVALFLIGVVTTYMACKFADELWDMARHGKNITF